jgi:predicted Zn-dependent protease
MHANTSAYFGRFYKARELSRLAVGFARRNDFKERAALLLASEALQEAWLGNSEAADAQARAALSSVPGRDVRALAALALAGAGDAKRAARLADQLGAEFPWSTLVHNYWLPTIRAEIELRGGNYNRAIELLQAARPYELADTPSPLSPIYVRAEAYLRARQGELAATEFQKIVEHCGIVANSPLGALGHLGMARACAISGKTGEARSKYKEFFALWKDADTSIPLLKQAKAEYLRIE